jgi:hypothetical protein
LEEEIVRHNMKLKLRLEETSIAALLGAAGASLVPLLLQQYIPGGPIGIFLVCLLMGFIVYKGVDRIF